MSLTDLMSMIVSDLKTREKILAKMGKRDFSDCFQCAKCTSGCTAFKLLELKPQEIMNLVNLGFIEELVASEIIWTCATCLKCTERCPQGTSPYHVIVALQNMAAKRGENVPETYFKAVSQILETGLMQTVQKVTTNKMETVDREKLGLPKIKSPGETFKIILLKALEEHVL